MTGLPADASPESQLRYGLALELAALWPDDAVEIALSGSTARGEADAGSDIEIQGWSSSIPDVTARRAWLEGIGATDILPREDDLEIDGTRWWIFGYRGIWVEMGWGTIGGMDSAIDLVRSGERSGHYALLTMRAISSALPLRSAGNLARWQAAVGHYPDALRRRVIEVNTEAWSDPHVPGVRRTLARRGERMALAMRLIWDMQNAWAVLFAVNRQWEANYKWIDSATRDLALQPDRLAERIDEVFVLTDLERSIRIAYELTAEVLDLVPEEYEVSLARRHIRMALDEMS